MSALDDDVATISREIRFTLIGVTFFAPFTAAIFSKSINTEGKWISILNCFAAGFALYL